MQNRENDVKQLAIAGVDDDNQLKTPNNIPVVSFIQEAGWYLKT